NNNKQLLLIVYFILIFSKKTPTCNCYIFIKQQLTHGFTDNVASPYNNNMLSFNRYFFLFQHMNNTKWCTRVKCILIRHHFADVNGMKPIHVFSWVYRFDDFLFINMVWKRQLNKNTMYM